MPQKFHIYCDLAGDHYMLLEERGERVMPFHPEPIKPNPPHWLAFKFETRTLCFLSSFNLTRLQFVGRAVLA